MKIDELHDRLYEVLCTIDDICRENDIRYFLDSGTELGAVREKDFIPWDDDMDIKICAEDLRAFLKCMKKNLPEHMHIVTPKVFSSYFLDFVLRIYDDRYLLRKESDIDRAYGNYQNHVGTDVFLLQKMPNSRITQQLTIVRLKMLYGFAMAHRYFEPDYNKYTTFQRMAVHFLTFVGKSIPLRTIYRQYLKILKRWEKKDTDYRMCSNYTVRHLDVMPSDIFKGTAYGEIRGRKFPIPKGFDRELTLIYGDYMKPPKDKGMYIRHLDEEEA